MHGNFMATMHEVITRGEACGDATTARRAWKPYSLGRGWLGQAMAALSTGRRIDARFEDILAHAGSVSACWDDGERIIIHAGVAWELLAHGPDRCQQIRNELPEIRHDGPGAPLWLGGVAFDPQHMATDAWRGFPSARFRLPQRQWTWQDGECIEIRIEPPHGNAASARHGQPAPGPLRDASHGDAASLLPAQTRGHGAGPQPMGAGHDASRRLPATSRDDWAAGCRAIATAIRSGRVSKTVLARCDVSRPTDALQAFQRLRRTGDGTAYWFQESDAAFFGCTPERLVRIDAGQLTTHALAGSAGLGMQAGQALQESSKDTLEHELVTAFLRDRLVEAGVHDVHQADRGVRTLRHVQHLETPILGRVEGMHVLDIAHHLQPTPAVCGTPRQSSMELIRTLEGFPRGWFAGSVGWFDAQGDGELCVALRSALSTPEAMHAFAGAGIVAGSQADAEWQETEAKLASIQEAL